MSTSPPLLREASPRSDHTTLVILVAGVVVDGEGVGVRGVVAGVVVVVVGAVAAKSVGGGKEAVEVVDDVAVGEAVGTTYPPKTGEVAGIVGKAAMGAVVGTTHIVTSGVIKVESDGDKGGAAGIERSQGCGSSFKKVAMLSLMMSAVSSEHMCCCTHDGAA